MWRERRGGEGGRVTWDAEPKRVWSRKDTPRFAIGEGRGVEVRFVILEGLNVCVWVWNIQWCGG